MTLPYVKSTCYTYHLGKRYIYVYDILYKSISPTFMYHLVLHKFFQCAPSFCPPQNMPFAKHAPPTRTAPTRSRGVKPRPVAQGRQQPLSRRRPTVVRIQFLAGLLRLPSHHSTTIDARRAAELARPRMQTPNLHFLQEQKRCPTNASASHCVTKSSLKGIDLWKLASDQKFMPKTTGEEKKGIDFTAAWSPSLGAANQWKQRLQHCHRQTCVPRQTMPWNGCARIPANPKKKARTGPSTKSSPTSSGRTPRQRNANSNDTFDSSKRRVWNVPCGRTCSTNVNSAWPGHATKRPPGLPALRLADTQRTNGYQPATWLAQRRKAKSQMKSNKKTMRRPLAWDAPTKPWCCRPGGTHQWATNV